MHMIPNRIILCGRDKSCCPTMTQTGNSWAMTDDFGGTATFSRNDLDTMSAMANGVGPDDVIEHGGIKMLGHQAQQIAKNL